ncbi:MAG: dihydrodipicolinate synthase family protein [Gammaproteobacteria bacterium]|nr:dihydrodipicolinate synthase family protein [Gammaproteobacteria bacterium]
MTNSTFNGIIAYTVTPFDQNNDQINLDVMYQIIDDLINSGAEAIAVLGSAGECVYLSEQEWQLVAQQSIAHIAGRVPVIVGICELTTKKAVERAIFAHDLGADAIMVSPFSYYKLTDNEIYDHYQSISDNAAIPIMIYNNPMSCGVDMSPTLMLNMIKHIEQAQMIKESSGNIQRIHQIYRTSNGSVPCFNGSNHIALDAFNAGAQGWCTVTPNLIGDLPKQLLQAIKNNDQTLAKTLFFQQQPLLEFITKHGLAVTVKAGLTIKHINAGDARLPLKPLPASEVEKLKDILTLINHNTH